MDIGGRITELRREKGLTQQELADRLYVSRQLVSKWESGERRPDYKTVEKIAETLDAKPEDIVREEDVIIEELAACVPDDGKGRNDCIDLPALLNGFLKTLPEAACDIFIRRYRAHETPEEIGISIAAEMILVRAEHNEAAAAARHAEGMRAIHE